MTLALAVAVAVTGFEAVPMGLMLMLLVIITVGMTPQRRKPRWFMRMRHSASILPLPDALRTKDVVDCRGTVRVSVQPALHGLEHSAVGLIVHVTDSGVVEDAQTVVCDFCF